MNFLTTTEPQENHAVAMASVAMMMDPVKLQSLVTFADLMAKSAVTVPQHLRGKPSDCLAICMQAVQWGMNPFSVSQKTHLTQGGQLGYEAQLVNAAIIGSGQLRGRPEYEFLGDWSKILGRVEERAGQSGGKYYVATWTKRDEDGLGVVIRAHIVGEDEPRQVTVMMSQAYPRFSTQWATDPQQQISYLAVRKFARRYLPEVILGVYTDDELVEADVPLRPGTRHMGTVDEVGTGSGSAPTDPPAKPAYPDAEFNTNLKAWEQSIKAAQTTPDRVIARIQTTYSLTDEQIEKIRQAPKHDLVKRMEEATTEDALNDMGDLIRSEADQRVAKTLSDVFMLNLQRIKEGA